MYGNKQVRQAVECPQHANFDMKRMELDGISSVRETWCGR